MAKKQKEEKIDIFDIGWKDEFDDDFYFIRGAVDLTRACFSRGGDEVSDGSVAAIFEEVTKKLDKMRIVIDRVHDSQCDPKILKRIQKMKAL